MKEKTAYNLCSVLETLALIFFGNLFFVQSKIIRQILFNKSLRIWQFQLLAFVMGVITPLYLKLQSRLLTHQQLVKANIVFINKLTLVVTLLFLLVIILWIRVLIRKYKAWTFVLTLLCPLGMLTTIYNIRLKNQKLQFSLRALYVTTVVYLSVSK